MQWGKSEMSIMETIKTHWIIYKAYKQVIPPKEIQIGSILQQKAG